MLRRTNIFKYRLVVYCCAIALTAAGLASCNKDDESIAPAAFVGNWYMTSYMEDANGNRTNDDARTPPQPYERYTLNFKNDGKLLVHSERDQSNVFDLSYDWTVSSNNDIMVHLTENTPNGVNRYSIVVAALSNTTLVLLHDNNSSAPALRFTPPHWNVMNWLIFTRQ